MTTIQSTVGSVSANRLHIWSAVWGQIVRTIEEHAKSRKIASSIRELSRLDDHQLIDMGISRSELTPEGLAKASFARSKRQAEI